MKLVRYNPAAGEQGIHEDAKPYHRLIHPGPCCHYKTLAERNGYEPCPVYVQEDDGQDDHDAHVARGGQNGDRSLTQACRTFQSFGACEESMLPNVRKPTDQERGL